MSSVLKGLILGNPDLPETTPCVKCGEKVLSGASWLGLGGNVVVCTLCILDGKLLGSLLGDAASDPSALQRYLDITERQAWRALALAQSWRSEKGRDYPGGGDYT